MPSMSFPRIARAIAATSVGALLLAGCAAAPSEPEPEATAGSVSIENCGRELTFDSASERVVGLWQPVNETLLALGLEDRIVAFAGNYTALRSDLAPQAEGIPEIGTGLAWPSREVLLTQEPDFVVSELIEGFAFDESQGYATVAQIEETGAQVYATSACTFDDSLTKSIDTVFADLENLGQIFGVEDRATEIIDDLSARRDAVEEAVAGRDLVRVAFYNGGEGPLFVLSGGVWGDSITTAGGESVFPSDAFQVSLEEFAASDAEVILVGTYDGQDFETLRDFLVATFPELPAVRDGRIVEVPTIETEASVRVMDGLERIANALHPDAGIDVRAY